MKLRTYVAKWTKEGHEVGSIKKLQGNAVEIYRKSHLVTGDIYGIDVASKHNPACTKHTIIFFNTTEGSTVFLGVFPNTIKSLLSIDLILNQPELVE